MTIKIRTSKSGTLFVEIIEHGQRQHLIPIGKDRRIAEDVMKAASRILEVRDHLPAKFLKTKLLTEDPAAQEALVDAYKAVRTDHVILGDFRRSQPQIMRLIKKLDLVIQ